MLMSMNEDIQSVIIAVQNYKKFVVADFVVRNGNVGNFDWYGEVLKYYNSLNLPDGMIHNSKRCLDAVLSYPIEDTLNTESGDLMEKFNFGY